MSNPTGKHTGKAAARALMKYRNRVNENLAANYGFKAPVMSAYLTGMLDDGHREGLAVEETARRINEASWGRAG